MLLAGLQRVLGEHVHQAGSNITPERLRFDFTHPEKVTSEQLGQVVEFVNMAICDTTRVTCDTVPKQQAKESGVE